jgi:hypothetical protein
LRRRQYALAKSALAEATALANAVAVEMGRLDNLLGMADYRQARAIRLFVGAIRRRLVLRKSYWMDRVLKIGADGLWPKQTSLTRQKTWRSFLLNQEK